jgi:hypothetical protein
MTGVPKGMVIHHKDEDKFNNSPNNLECLSRSDHMKIHCRSNFHQSATTISKESRGQRPRSAEIPEKEYDIV